MPRERILEEAHHLEEAEAVQKIRLLEARGEAIQKARGADFPAAVNRARHACRLSSEKLRAYCQYQYAEIEDDLAMLQGIGRRLRVNLVPLLLYPDLVVAELPTTHNPEVLVEFNDFDDQGGVRLKPAGIIVRRLIEKGRFGVFVAGGAGRRQLGMMPQPDHWPPARGTFMITENGSCQPAPFDLDFILFRANALPGEERTPGAASIFKDISQKVPGIVTAQKISATSPLNYVSAALNPDRKTYFTPAEITSGEGHIVDALPGQRPRLSPPEDGLDIIRHHPAFPPILMMLMQPSVEGVRLALVMEKRPVQTLKGSHETPLISAKTVDPFHGLEHWWTGLTFPGAEYEEGESLFHILSYPYSRWAFTGTVTGLWQVANMVRAITTWPAVLYPPNPGFESRSRTLENRLTDEAHGIGLRLSSLAQRQRAIMHQLVPAKSHEFCRLWTNIIIKACDADAYRFAVAISDPKDVDTPHAVAGTGVAEHFLPHIANQVRGNLTVYRRFLQRLLVEKHQGHQNLATFLEAWQHTFGESPDPERLFRPAFARDG